MDITSDEEIQRHVLAEMRFDTRVHPNEVGVTVKQGVVTLLGNVDSYFTKWAAEDAAQRVRGVKAIANELEVRLPASAERTDDEIAATVATALASDALVPEDVTATIADGWVTLRGEVRWNYQKQEAERIVTPLWGVKGVTNTIEVKASGTTSAELKEKIETALLRRAEVDSDHIEVEVHGSRVILRGTVHSWAERTEAERTAWTAPGITHVDDQIVVAYA